MLSRHPAGSGRGLAQVHDPVTVRAPAKINLFLGVGGLRPDGYHAVTNVAQAVSLYDEVTARAARGVSASVRGEDADAVPSRPGQPGGPGGRGPALLRRGAVRRAS